MSSLAAPIGGPENWLSPASERFIAGIFEYMRNPRLICRRLVHASRSSCLCLGVPECGQQQSSENRNDRDNDQQLSRVNPALHLACLVISIRQCMAVGLTPPNVQSSGHAGPTSVTAKRNWRRQLALPAAICLDPNCHHQVSVSANV